jgi:hypothetical protein
MRFLTVPSLLIAAIPWAASAAVDPGLLDLTPPDAKVLSGVQVEQALRSSFGQFALAQIPQNDPMMQFIAATGFDFRRDMREILIASDGAPVRSGAATNLILVHGAFQPAKIAGLAALAGATSTSYSGIPIITAPNGSQPVSGAFVDADTLILGPTSAIKDAIDRRSAGVHNSGALAQKAIAASGMYDVWIATAAPLSSFSIPNLGGVPATVFSSIQEASAGIRFDSAGGNVTGEAVTRTGQDAMAIAGMGQLLLALVQSNKAPGAQASAALFQNAKIAADGVAVRLTLSIPEQQLEQMFAARPTTKKVALPSH